MRLKTITITNVKGIEFIEIRAGALTVLSGGNGVGKSSVLDAVRAVFEGGHDSSMIRLGEKKAEVLITLEDGITLRRTITEKSSTLEIRTKDGAIVPKPQSFVETIAAGFAFDPLGLMTADPKKRAQFLLEAMPITFEPYELNGAGLEGATKPVDLDGLAALRDGIYESRKVLNRAVRDAEGTVVTLQQGLPEQDGKDWNAELQQLEADAAQAEVEIKEAETQAVKDTNEAETEALAQFDGQIDQLQAQIETIKSQIASIKEQRSSRRAELQNQHAQKLREIAKVADPARQELTAKKATAWANAQAQAKAVGLQQTITAMRAKVRTNFLEAERLTKVIEGLDALRKAKLATLPIEGVEIRDGEIYVEGVPYDQINTANQAALSIKLAKLHGGGFMVADRLEMMDEQMWADFGEAVKESGLQVLGARVTEGPLAVASS